MDKINEIAGRLAEVQQMQQDLLQAVNEHIESQQADKSAAEATRDAELALRRRISRLTKNLLSKIMDAELEISQGRKAGAARVDAILQAGRDLREAIPHDEIDPEETEARRKLEELQAQLNQQEKILASLG